MMVKIETHRCASNAHLPVCRRLHIRQVTTPLDTRTRSISISKVPEFAPQDPEHKQYSFATNHRHTCRLLYVFRAICNIVTADLKENATGVKFSFKLCKTASATWTGRPDIKQRPAAAARHVRSNIESN